jgi:hypothetical protein
VTCFRASTTGPGSVGENRAYAAPRRRRQSFSSMPSFTSATSTSTVTSSPPRRRGGRPTDPSELNFIDENNGYRRTVTGEGGVTSPTRPASPAIGAPGSPSSGRAMRPSSPSLQRPRESLEPGSASPPLRAATTATEPIEEIDSSFPFRETAHHDRRRRAQDRQARRLAFATPAFCVPPAARARPRRRPPSGATTRPSSSTSSPILGPPPTSRTRPRRPRVSAPERALDLVIGRDGRVAASTGPVAIDEVSAPNCSSRRAPRYHPPLTSL